MAGSDQDAEKEFDPTPQKLQEARRKGDVPRSQDLTTAAAQGGLLLALLLAGGFAVERLGTALAGLLGNPTQLADALFGGGEGAFAGQLLSALALPLAPLFALPAVVALAAIVAQRGIAPSGEKLMPKLSRINPLANARQKFGIDGLFEFGKSAAKLAITAGLLFWFLKGRMPEILVVSQTSARSGIALMTDLLQRFLMLAAIIGGAIGGIDLLWQHQAHRRKLRMTRQEMKDEHKQSEGDPHAKQARRQRGYDIATNRMLTDVPDADVVVVNPTHYAVALKWERLPGKAPVCVAKGVDEVAAAIRRRAMELGVPIHSDPPTARALHATVDIGAEIEPDHYRTVAAAIRFAERMRQRAGPRSRPAR